MIVNIFKRAVSACVCAAFLTLTACKPDEDIVTVTPIPSNEETAALAGLARLEYAIVNDFDVRASELRTAIITLKAFSTQAALDTAKAAWRLARQPWEQNESFGFGPVGTLGIDGNVDDCPLNLVDVKGILASKVLLSVPYVEGLGTSSKGFHAMEFLLFGEKNDKTASTLTAREIEMVDALSANFKTQTEKLKAAWMPAGNSFGVQFTNAGKQSSVYKTRKDALLEVVGSMVDICDELPNSKIEIPLAMQSNQYAESQFSDNTLEDYKNNILGVQAAYTGRYAARSGMIADSGIGSIVAVRNAALHAKVLAQLDDAFYALEYVPEPFSRSIVTMQARLRRAQDKINQLRKTLNEEVKPLIGG